MFPVFLWANEKTSTIEFLALTDICLGGNKKKKGRREEGKGGNRREGKKKEKGNQEGGRERKMVSYETPQ